MVDEIIVNAIVFGGSVMGGFARAMFPYLRKLKEIEDKQETGEEQPIKFQRKYLYTSIFSVVLALFIGMTLYSGLLSDINVDEVTEASLAGIFMASLLAAWGANDVFNQILSTGTPTSTKIEPAPMFKPKEGEGTTTTAATNTNTNTNTTANTTKTTAGTAKPA
jgi:hypothetical protein